MRKIDYWTLRRTLKNAIEDGFKELLERKHLYQNIVITPPPFNNEIYLFYKQELKDDVGTYSEEERKYNSSIDSAKEISWEVISKSSLPEPAGSMLDLLSVFEINSFSFEPPTIKVFCSFCKSIQPYNFIDGFNVYKSYCCKNQVQIFVLTYECQACKNPPEVFMIRREKMKLIQSGRTPMEQIDILKFIPKSQRKFFSDAVIAFNSGQILVGKFLLRTFIEQFIRDFTKDKTSTRMDDLLLQYAGKLPNDFKQRFPSLTKIYSQLSEHIHQANSSVDLFTQAKKDIESHFEAKDIFDRNPID